MNLLLYIIKVVDNEMEMVSDKERTDKGWSSVLVFKV